MRLRRTWPLLLSGTLLFSCAEKGREGGRDPGSPNDPDTGADDEKARAAWNKQYYPPAPTPDYLDFKLQVAERQADTYRNTLPSAVATTTAPTWSNLGPTNGGSNSIGQNDPGMEVDSGRLRAIVTDPTNAQIIYLASSNGGVFKATNAALNSTTDWNWTPITDNLPFGSAMGNLAVGDLAMSPTTNTTLYLAMGDPTPSEGGPSRGFFYTTDGGATWTKGGTLGNAMHTWKVLPINSTTLLVATDDGAFRSTDGGVTFTRTTINSGDVGSNIYSLARTTDGTVLAVHQAINGGSASTFHYSTDGGVTWAQATVSGLPTNFAGVTRVTLAAAPSTTNTAYALVASYGSFYPGLLKTTNSGRSWSYVTPTGNGFSTNEGQADYNQLITVDPDSAQNVFVGTQIGTYRSMDGGVTWVELSNNGMPNVHSDFHCATWSKTGTKTLFIGSDGGLAVFKDPLRNPPSAYVNPPDTTYIDLTRNRGLATHLVYNITSTQATSPSDSSYRVAIGTQDNGIRLRVPDPTSGSIQASGKFDTWIGGDGFGVLYSPVNGNILLGGVNGALYRTTNEGANLTQVTGLNNLPFGVQLGLGRGDTTGNTMYVWGLQTVYKSSDAGATFAALPNPGTGNDQYFSIYQGTTSKTNASEIVVIGEGSNTNPLSPGFISINGGTSWTLMGGLDAPGLTPRGVDIDPRNATIIYVSGISFTATAHHLWKSTNSGATFTPIDGSPTASNGLAYGIPIWTVKADPVASGVVYAATDFGVYRSGDGGNTWTRYGVGLPLVSTRDLWLAPDGSLMRVGTWGRAAWELPIVRSTNTITASITAPSSDQTVNSGTAVSFTATATDSDTTQTLSTSWSFGDGGSASGLSTAHTFTNSGSADVTYTVTFTASDPTGASGLATRKITVHPAQTTVIANGDFETGSLSGWTRAGTTSVGGSAHGGSYAAAVGATTQTNGDSSVAQTFTAPAAGGSLSFYYNVHCPDSVTYDWATATLKDNTAASTATILAKTCTNSNTWKQVTATLTGGHSYTLTLVSHDDNYAGDATYTQYDDVTVTAIQPPPPSPLVNGDFETGSLTPWTSTGYATTSSTAHGGSWSALLGKIGNPTTDSTIAQAFTAPSTGGTLSFFYNVTCPDSVTYDWATATLKDNTANTSTTMLAKTCTSGKGWLQVSSTLVANHSYTLTLANHDDNYAGDATYTYFDDVTVK